MLQFRETGTDVDERTAELFSKQGNTDITEVVIDEMALCSVCEEHSAKGKSFCKCGSTVLQGLSAEQTKTMKESTCADNDFNQAGHNGEKDVHEVSQELSVKKPKTIMPQSIISGKHKEIISNVVQKDEETRGLS